MKYHLYYWGSGLEKWIQFFSTDSLDDVMKRFQSEKRLNPHLTLKATEENEFRIEME
jgi:hypothetical protein